MVDNVSFGFIKKSRDPAPDNLSSNKPASKTSINALSKKEEQVHKGILDLNRRLYKSISVFSKALESMEDTRETRNLKSTLGKAQKASSIQNKLRKGEVVTSEEARELIEAAESLNKVMQDNEKLRLKIKELGYKSEELDITEPLVTASQKIAESAKDLFITNAERITQSTAAADIAKTGVRAVSPELAFLTESLGVGLPDFFGSQEKEEELIVTEIVKLEEAVENLEDAVNTGQTKTAENQTENTKKHIKADKKLLEQKVLAEKANQETQLAVQADQHRETTDLLDDIRDSQNRTLFEKLMDFFDIRKSPFLKKAGIIAGATAAVNAVTSSTKARSIGATAVSAGKTALKAGAAVGGTVLGFDALRNIREEGLTSGNALQSVASGAMLGSVFGPIGAVIGGGVGAFAAAVTASISPEDMKTIESGLKSASDFISNGLGKGISSTIKHSKELYTAIQDGKLSEWFGKIGEGISTSTKEIRDKVNTKLSEAVSDYDWILTRIKSDINGFVTGYQNAGKSFREQYPQTSALNDELIKFILAPFKDIQFFLSSPKAYLASAFSVDKTEIDYYITEIIDFLINPLQRLKEALANTVNFLGLDSLKSNEAVTPGHKEHSPSGFIGDLLGKNKNIEPQIFFKQEGDLSTSPMVRYIKYPDGTEKRMPVKNFNVPTPVVSTPVNTTELNTNPTETAAESLMGTVIQNQAPQTEQGNPKSQSQQKRKTEGTNSKEEKGKELSYSGNGRRTQSNSPFASNDIGMLITVGGLA